MTSTLLNSIPQVSGGVCVFDDVLPDPKQYRDRVLASEFRDITLGGSTFKGISTDPCGALLPLWISAQFPALASKLTFFRKSPLGQPEPNFIHSDDMMGDWTGILYLNESPLEGDGTDFWAHKETGRIRANSEFSGESDWKHTDRWEKWHHVEAAFNRLVIFPAPYFHSRSIYSNYGAGNDARFIQVVFGTGRLS